MTFAGNVGGGLGKAVLDLETDKSKFSAGLRSAETEAQGWLNRNAANFRRTGAAISGVGQAMTTGLTLPIIGVAAATTKLGANFESSMQQIVGLVGIAQEQVDQWSQDLLELGPALGKTPQELAEGLYFVTSAGFEGAAALDVLEASAKASAAGLGETLVVADAVTSAVNAYGAANLSASKSTDILVVTVRLGKAEADAIAGVIGRLAPLAQSVGVSFDQVGAALAAMTRVGLSADEAGTSLQAIFSGLLKVTPAAEKVLNEYGLSAAGLRRQLREEGLLATLRELERAFEGNETALRETFPNIRALRGALNLLGQDAAVVDDIFAQMTDTTGETERAFAAASDTVQFRLDRSWAKIQASLISLADDVGPAVADALATLAGVVEAIADAFESMPKPARDAIIQFLGLVAAAGPLLLVFGKLVGGLGNLFVVLDKLPGGIAATSGGLTGLFRVAGKAGGLFLLIDTLLKLPGAFDAVGDAIEAFGDNAPKAMLEAVKRIFEAIPEPFRPPGMMAFLDGLEGELARAGEEAAGDYSRRFVDELGRVNMGGTAGAALRAGKDQVTAGAADMMSGVDDAVAGATAAASEAAKLTPGQIASGMLVGLGDLDTMLQALADEIVNSVSDAEERAAIEATLASQTIREGLSSESSKTRLDTLQLVEDLIGMYELVAPGALGAGELVNPAYIEGVLSNLDLASEVGDEFGRRYGQELDISGIAATTGAYSIASYTNAIRGGRFMAGLAAGEIVTAISGPLAAIDTYSWGQNAGGNFASGLESMYGAAHAAAIILGTAISGPLKFASPPKEGPLMGIMDWGAALPVTFAQGILSAIGAVGSATGALASLAAGTLSGIGIAGPNLAPVGGMSGGLGGVGSRGPTEIHYHYELQVQGGAFGIKTEQDLLQILRSLAVG